MLVGDGYGRIATEGRNASQQLIEKATGGVKIRPSIDHLAASLLWREVLRGAHHRVGLGHGRGRVCNCASNAKVHDLDLALLGKHDVARLDIAMDDAFAVRVLEGRKYANNNLNGLTNR